MELTTAQRTAIDRLTDFAMGRTPHGIATLSGYAGVGKTTVVAALLDEVSTALRVLVTAPTHKALAVLGSKLDDTQCELMTTHAALGMKLTELESGEHRLQREGSVSIADYDLAVVDEASMIHPDLFATMLSARRRCRILFVGDPAQLAPVGSDEISQAFGDVVPLHVRLDEVVRQAAEHPSIRFSIALCEDVAAGRAPAQLKLASLMQAGDERHMAITPGGEAALQTYALDAIRNGLDTRILAFTNRACIRHNEAIHATLYPGVQGFAVGEQVIAQEGFQMRGKHGDTVQVRTSELLTVEEVSTALHELSPDIPAWQIRLVGEGGKCGTAWVAQNRQLLEQEIGEQFGLWRRYKAEAKSADPRSRGALEAQAKKASGAAWALRSRYANIRHAYALTIHKSQGSTFETVLIDWSSVPNDAGADAARLAYVAITRPSRFAVIVTQ
jgi:exodeoxyribonuclease-5